ncbi:hypothetical protein [Flavihumibacter solisilvae]|jgi:hypothetical protein|uniref:DUF4468 domain-containing protein n=1 Tax=Flavihumibacter solisilvae TaxID=1349421 RepID=A0A0C1KZJ1_9BACT|nr:hypothetical protein [Flavihumibacter solisilvae]KIC93132.1 hypothetical protein OI18_19125 [Flavihumibacter solisilvae]
MKKLLTGTFVLLLSAAVSAQKIKLTDGELKPLAGEKEINTEFDYANMKVGKFDNEQDYVTKKKEEYNKKEAGKGDTWAKAWVDDRGNRFEPKFNELFAKSSGITSGTSAGSKYTMIVKTVFTEPGYNVGVWRANAEINTEITIVETANRKKVVAKIKMDKAVGRLLGFDYDTGLRISEAYGDGGKALGKFIKSKI